MNINQNEQNEIEFELWFDNQSIERVQKAFDKSVDQFDQLYWSMSEVDDYMNDKDFMKIFSTELQLLWIDDTMWGLQRKGAVEFNVAPDGTYLSTVTDQGQIMMDDYSEQYV